MNLQDRNEHIICTGESLVIDPSHSASEMVDSYTSGLVVDVLVCVSQHSNVVSSDPFPVGRPTS